ncbi:MAG: hypothetical protein P8X64_08310 [Anaerolineales bacterium]|jgi:hypothetical protein
MAKNSTIPTTAEPIKAQEYSVGDAVEVFCDHNNDEGNRVRDWLQGVVVQADEKMVAVQFTQDVYLTDGWMVPDRVLWTQQTSDTIRPSERKRRRRS